MGDIGRQPLAVFDRLCRVAVRDIVVDELTAGEIFKVYDDQIHMVQAYIRIPPPALDPGGWPIRAGVPQP